MLQQPRRRHTGTIGVLPHVSAAYNAMSFLKSFVAKHVMAAASAPPIGMDAVAVFFYGQAPALAEISSLAPDADVSVSSKDSKTRIAIAWPDVNLTITLDAAWDKQAQMVGM